jgi:type IV pilus assembly protein PilY1
MVMLTMARDHRLYYEAYNDASDINEDGILDTRYNPDIDYYGYFDSHKYYEYSSTNERFEPRGLASDKKAPSGNYWSGDFLNYVSMTRMDCLRKVLYGGFRYRDTATETVLERAYIPQDAHSFGKEYDSIARDGFDIREYTPLNLPLSGTRHLIATTALGTDGKPLLRVLNDSTAHIWEWVATERPVVKSNFGGSTAHPGHPTSKATFDNLATTYGTPTRMFGTGSPATIDGYNNPYGNDDNYMTLISGQLVVDTPGTYRFAINGDDAIDFRINGATWENTNLVTVTGDVIGWYGGHGATGTNSNYRGDTYLAAGTYQIEFRHEEAGGGDSYRLYWRNSAGNWVIVPAKTASTPIGLQNLTLSTYNLVSNAVITDYTLRVLVGVPSMPESNCKMYPNGTYKPVGVLQRHGESERMYFGLITGSYTKNLSGGVLRQPVGSIRPEINQTTGEFRYLDDSSVGGIIRTLDRLRIHGFRNDSNFDYNENCGWIVDKPLAEGQCRMWGNPMAEMMYETARYFSGAGSPTTQFTYSPTDANLDDNQIGLPLATWDTPYNSTNYCAKPIMLAISDIYPSYDSDQLPGSAWPTTISSTLTGLSVNTGIQSIAGHEGVNGTFYIGQNGAPSDTGYDGACTPKTIGGLDNIRGLCPEEPSKQGSYYAAAVTHFAATTDLSTEEDDQKMASYMVALSSPLPEIKIPVGGNIITMVPFGKSVGGGAGGGTISAATGSFQPTNTIVDFFVEEITPTTGTFRVNFEDVEQGADHDMDAIVRYHYEVIDNSTGNITLTSEYAAGSIIQHMGYIISGTTADRTYLVVKDRDTSDSADPDYHLDYPNTTDALPHTSTITFTPGTTAGANLLKNPLWYAAKWGGFEDINGNNIPDLQKEWDKNEDGIPDTYFFVANPTRLEEQLNKAFDDILRRTSSGTTASVISQSREGDGAVYQSIFFPELKQTTNWAGQAHALFVDSFGNIREDTNGNTQLDLKIDKIIIYDETKIYRFHDINGDNILDSSERNSTAETLDDVQKIKFLWSTTNWLNSLPDSDVVAQRSQYNATTSNRYIVTFADKNENMLVDSGELQDFVWPPSSPVPTPSAALNGATDFYAYLTLFPSFDDTPSAINTLRSGDPTGFASLLNEFARRQVDFIRGADQNSTTVGGYALNATRSRFYMDDHSTARTWRLGDVVFSTPTVVGKPAENYHLLYIDNTYEKFLKQYRNRRQVVYVGANDGMLHAFNGGFYNSTRRGFDLQYNGETEFELGMELWGYIPYNLLPHLLWLTDPNYGKRLHVSYVDLKPRAFDARVFFQSDGITPLDEDHPDGWGTILVTGMRLGGGKIRADLDKTDGNGFNAGDRTMSSAYVIMDVTNPEKPPRVLAEIRMPNQGFTTCYPTVMPMGVRGSAAPLSENQWYLVFGSGPANALGEADPMIINTDTSSQNGQLYVLDLLSLASQGSLVSLDTTGQFTAGTHTFATTEPGSFISDPIAVDFDIGAENSGEFRTDVVYYGTVSGDQTFGQGTLRRLITKNTLAVAGAVTWSGNATLADVGKPVTAAPSVAMDEQKRIWVYFGAGRFFNRDDIPQAHGMSFFGIKEPVSAGILTWAEVNDADLYNSTQISLTNGTCVGDAYTRDCVRVYKSGTLMSGGWTQLETEVAAASGWRQDFQAAYERVLGQAAVLGGTVLFTSYLPSQDLCEFEGSSRLWALFYKTGTAYFRPILRNASDPFATYVDLGRGLAMTPNIHIGEKEGSTAFIQTSTGAIETIEIANPFTVKSGSLFWLKRTDN